MSRCFPFPPPGYEKKLRSGEHGDLLAKEKHKEKKQKKEDRERKDTDKSKGTHKEKKERKEKHRGRKKGKDRDREKNKTSEDQRTEIHHEDKLGYDSCKTDEYGDSKFTEELGRRIRHEEQGATNIMVEDISAIPNRKIESVGTSTAMVNKMPTNATVTIQGNEKFTSSFHKRTELMEISTTTENQKATRTEKVHGITSTEQGRNEYLIPQVQKRTETMGNTTAKEKQRATNNHKVVDFTNLVERTESMFNVNSIKKERVTNNNLVSNTFGSSAKRNDHAMENLASIPRRIESVGAAPATEKERFLFRNIIGTEQRRAEGMVLPMEKGADKKTEGKEKSKEKAEDGKREVENGASKKTEGKEKSKEKKAEVGKKEGDKDREQREKKRKENDKNRDKEKKKEEKKRGKCEHKRSKHDKLKENEINNPIPNLNHKTLAPHVENVNAIGADGTNKKRKEFEGNPDGSDGPNKRRKEFEMNGFLHEPQHDRWHSKLPRTNVASCHPLVENGRPKELASGCSPIKLGSINNTTVVRGLVNNGKHVNGEVEVQPSAVPKPSVPPVVDSSVKVVFQPSPVLKPPIPHVVDSSGKAAIQPSPVVKPPIPSVIDSSGKVAVQPSRVPTLPIPPVVQPSRPPHPDTKYLTIIYTVPKIEELSEFDDLDWLFNDKRPPSTMKVEVDGMLPQMGAKGLHIESADVFALPYVIPF